MNEEQLYESVNGIDEETLEKSEKAKPSNRWKMIVVLAACFCLVITAVIWTVSWGDGNFYFNDAVEITSGLHILDLDAGIRDYVKEPLTEKEINALLPNKRSDWMQFSDTSAVFDEKGRIQSASLRNGDPESANAVYVSFFRRMTGDGLYAADGKAEPSRYRGVEYYVYQWKSKNGSQDITMLTAVTHIRGVWLRLQAYVPDESLDEAKVHFEQMLKCFGHYGWTKPNIEKLSLGYVPEYIDEELTYEQATQERDFGKYIPETIPEGFSFYSCERKKNSKQNVLNIHWRKDNESTRWEVKYYDPEYGYSYLENADTLELGDVILRSGKYGSWSSAWVRFDDVVIYVYTEGHNNHLLVEELIKIRDRLQ